MNKIKELETSFVNTWRAVWRVTRISWQAYPKPLTISLVVGLLLSIMPFVNSWVYAQIINGIVAAAKTSSGLDTKLVLGVVAWFCVVYMGSRISTAGRSASKRTWIKVNEFFELKFLAKRGELDVATFEDPIFNDLLQRAEEKGSGLFPQFLNLQIQNVTNVLQVLIAGGVFVYGWTIFGWKFFVLAISSAIPDFFIEAKYGRTAWHIYGAEAPVKRKYWSVRNQLTNLPRLIELKVFQNVDRFRGLVTEMLHGFNDKQLTLEEQAARWRGYSDLVSLIPQAILYYWIFSLTARGKLPIGTMTFFIASLGRFQSALTGLSVNIAQQLENSRYIIDSFKFLDTQPRVISPIDGVRVTRDTIPLIEFRDVSFAYPGTESLALRNINLTIRPGECFAMVGENGAGKSTLIKLLARFYDPTSGEILVNGVNLRSLDLESWYGCVAAIFQDYAVYNFPVREVIALGRSNGTPHTKQVLLASRAADAHSFISEWPLRYDQMIGKQFDHGIDPSQGQRQKIALARCFYRDPRVMILDEPTASIDAAAEESIFQRLEERRHDCTQILISHRFSTVRHANRICVLEKGAIAELGSHDELVALDGTYARLYELQARAYR